MQTLLAPNDYASLWAVMAVGTALSIWLEQKYRWAARLSGPVLALLIAMALSNTRVVPMESPAYDFVGDWLVPLAIPLLLFRANIRQIIGTGGRMFFIVHIAALGSLLGVALSVVALRAKIPDLEIAYASGLMAASYIGGGVNFFAIKASYNVPENIAAPLLVADNLVMAGFFIAILAVAGSRWFLARYAHPHIDGAHVQQTGPALKSVTVMDLGMSIGVAFSAMALASALGRAGKGFIGDTSGAGALMQTVAVIATNRFVLLTLVSLAIATLFSKALGKVNGPEELGGYLLALFLFTIGLPADLVRVVQETPIYFVFCAIIAIANIGFTLAVGKLLKLNLEELLLAVNATLGGPPTAAAMAASAGWPKLVIPGLLAGLWGYVIGTPLGIMVVELLRR